MSSRIASPRVILKRDCTGDPKSISEIPAHFARCWRPVNDWEREQFERMPSIEQAIRAAVLSCTTLEGHLHPHQQLVGRNRLDDAAPIFERKARQIAGQRSFDALHRTVASIARDINGIGELAVYDFSTRIGMYLRIYPKRVYLHAGTRAGAAALGISGKTCEMRQLPKELRVLSPDEAEDCLCLYASVLKASQMNRQRPSWWKRLFTWRA